MVVRSFHYHGSHFTLPVALVLPMLLQMIHFLRERRIGSFAGGLCNANATNSVIGRLLVVRKSWLFRPESPCVRTAASLSAGLLVGWCLFLNSKTLHHPATDVAVNDTVVRSLGFPSRCNGLSLCGGLHVRPFCQSMLLGVLHLSPYGLFS